MGSFGKNAFATTRLPTHKQGIADFQRTLNPRLTGIYHHVTSPFCLQLLCITIQNLMQAESAMGPKSARSHREEGCLPCCQTLRHRPFCAGNMDCYRVSAKPINTKLRFVARPRPEHPMEAGNNHLHGQSCAASGHKAPQAISAILCRCRSEEWFRDRRNR
jgi:hypothetical protein